MYKRRVPVLSGQVAVDSLLGRGVAPEVDGAAGGHSHQIGHQATEEAPGALVLHDVPEQTVRIRGRNGLNLGRYVTATISN